MSGKYPLSKNPYFSPKNVFLKMKTYVLLVGLNEYQEKKINKLEGCINDITRFEEYLLVAPAAKNVDILKLQNEEATKSGIVTAFKTHFANAQKGDICLFYFSGHGVLQYANPVFKSEAINSNLECLACYDTRFTGTGLLADKELRWLIHDLYEKSKGCHILTIFDCCHSGDNTRDSGGNALQERTIRAGNGVKFIMPERAWTDFIFHENVPQQRAIDSFKANKHLDVVFPQGKHIQLAACASNETAKEDYCPEDASLEKAEMRGYFTFYLLELLKSSNGKITYYELRSLIYSRLSRFSAAKQQTPQFYTVEESIFQPFLGGAPQTEITATIHFNTDKKQWEMNRGDIYGIQEGATVFVTLPHKNNEVEAAIVKEVAHDCSVLFFDIEAFETQKEIEKGLKEADKRIRRADIYTASVNKFIQRTVKVACVAPSIAALWANYAAKYAVLLENAMIQAVSSVAEADYVLNTEGPQIFLARPQAARPLVEMVSGAGSNDSFETIVKQLTAVSRWEFVRMQTSNPEAEHLLDNVSIQFSVGKNTQNISDLTTIICPIVNYRWYEKEELNYWLDPLQIKIVNNHPNKTLYIAGIWLSEYFGIKTTIINEQSLAMPIERTQKAFVFNENFYVNFRKHILTDKWSTFDNYLKIYVSDRPFEVTQFQQLALDYPRKEVEKSLAFRGSNARDAMGELPIELQENSVAQWAVKTIKFEFDVSKLLL